MPTPCSRRPCVHPLHPRYGAVSAFFWKHLAGLRPALPGWRRAIVAPAAERCELHVDVDAVAGPGLFRSWNMIIGSNSQNDFELMVGLLSKKKQDKDLNFDQPTLPSIKSNSLF